MKSNKLNTLLPSRLTGGLPTRAPTQMANPAPQTGMNRQVASIKSDDPRVLNPGLNMSPWSTTYAVNRRPPVGSSRKINRSRKG